MFILVKFILLMVSSLTMDDCAIIKLTILI
jgi:hypothetical protein